VALGILAGDLVRVALGHGGPSIGLAVCLAVGFARLLDERPLMLFQAGISAVLRSPARRSSPVHAERATAAGWRRSGRRCHISTSRFGT
jgi:hypothetical protein